MASGVSGPWIQLLKWSHRLNPMAFRSQSHRNRMKTRVRQWEEVTQGYVPCLRAFTLTLLKTLHWPNKTEVQAGIGSLSRVWYMLFSQVQFQGWFSLVDPIKFVSCVLVPRRILKTFTERVNQPVCHTAHIFSLLLCFSPQHTPHIHCLAQA